MTDKLTLYKLAVRSFLFYKHGFVVTWKTLRGRWFVYRDLPLWFVAEMATMKNADGDAFIGRMIAGAEEALTSRVNALSRAAAAISESTAGTT